MSEHYKIQDVTEDLKFALTLTSTFEADDEGFWHEINKSERYIYKIDGNDSGKPIVLFQDPMPKGDYYFFNPYAEGLGKRSEATLRYYQAIRVALNAHLFTAITYVAQQVLQSKLAAIEKTEYPLDIAVVRMSSVKYDKKSTLHDMIDEQFLEEISIIHERLGATLVHVPHIPEVLTTKVTCAALTTGEKWDDLYGKDIRKKSLLAYKALVMGVLGIKSPAGLETFTVKYDPDLKTSPRFYTTLLAYLKIYSSFNEILAVAYGTEDKPNPYLTINLGELRNILERSHLAYAIAKHTIQPTYTPSATPESSTVDTSKMRFETGTRSRFSPAVEPAGSGSGGIRISSGSQESRRFAPVVAERVVDPFAFSSGISSQPSQGTFGAGGFGGGGTSFGGLPSSRSFGGQPSGANFAPSSNFGSPSLTQRYFGRS